MEEAEEVEEMLAKVRQLDNLTPRERTLLLFVEGQLEINQKMYESYKIALRTILKNH